MPNVVISNLQEDVRVLIGTQLPIHSLQIDPWDVDHPTESLDIVQPAGGALQGVGLDQCVCLVISKMVVSHAVGRLVMQ